MKAFAVTTALLLSACTAGDMGLAKVHADIVSDIPRVQHIVSENLTTLNNPIFLDIRDADEFAVSHLPNAIQIPPDADLKTALAKVGNVSGRPIVVYCSVGRRSSVFAARMQETLISQGATQVSNLENGIFGWHNNEHPLMNAHGQTDAVHPYNTVWKRYVRRKDKAVYTPN